MPAAQILRIVVGDGGRPAVFGPRENLERQIDGDARFRLDQGSAGLGSTRDQKLRRPQADALRRRIGAEVEVRKDRIPRAFISA